MRHRRTSDAFESGWSDRSRRDADARGRPARARRSRRARRTASRYETRGQRDRWLVSYADFITLLFAFFTTLYAASSVDALKLGRMVESMQQAFDRAGIVADRRALAEPASRETTPPEDPASRAPGPVAMNAPLRSPDPLDSVPLEAVPIAVPTTGSTRISRGAAASPASFDAPGGLDEVQARLAERLAGELESGQVALEMDHRGLVVSIRETGSFGVGSAELSQDANRIMGRLAATFAEIPNPIRVEGHTDDVPIHTARFASNWELSTARAIEVVAFLVQRVGLDPSRLSAAGYSEYRPRFPNATSAGRARNRRVDLVILNAETMRAEEPRALETTR